MILVDTSVWVDHLRSGVSALASLLDEGMVLTHPFVIGELALGDLRRRATVMDALSGLARASVATDEEVLQFIDRQALFGRGVGYVDVHLLVAARLTAGTDLWTNDRRLGAIAAELGIAYDFSRAYGGRAHAAPYCPHQHRRHGPGRVAEADSSETRPKRRPISTTAASPSRPRRLRIGPFGPT